MRIRTVTYGEGDEMVKFDKEPFVQRFPAKWIDTITAPIDFDLNFVADPLWTNGNAITLTGGSTGTFDFNTWWTFSDEVTSGVKDTDQDPYGEHKPSASYTYTSGITFTSAPASVSESSARVTYTWGTASDPNFVFSGKSNAPVVTYIGDRTEALVWANILAIGTDTITVPVTIYYDGVPSEEKIVTITLTGTL